MNASIEPSNTSPLFFAHTDTLNNLLFGVTGGLLSLVGLIAIFISINSQHNIQKAREILWELQSFRIDYPESNDITVRKLVRLFEHYRELVKLNKPMLFVVSLAVLTLIFVSTSWVLYFIALKPNLNHKYEFKISIIFISVGSLIILLFILLLVFLSRVSFIGGLPHPRKFLDINNKKVNISELYLRAMAIEVSPASNVLLSVFFLLPINNLKLVLKVFLENQDGRISAKIIKRHSSEEKSDIWLLSTEDLFGTQQVNLNDYDSIRIVIALKLNTGYRIGIYSGELGNNPGVFYLKQDLRMDRIDWMK